MDKSESSRVMGFAKKDAQEGTVKVVLGRERVEAGLFERTQTGLCKFGPPCGLRQSRLDSPLRQVTLS